MGMKVIYENENEPELGTRLGKGGNLPFLEEVKVKVFGS